MLTIRDYQADEVECRRQHQQEAARRYPAAATDDEQTKKKAAADREKEAREYCVQRRSAIAGERQGDIGKWAAGVSFLALLAAAAAAVFSYRTVRTMQETGERQLRAYVFLDVISLVDASQLPLLPADSVTQGDLFGRSPDLAEDAPQNRPRGYPGVEWAVKNTGQTPAYEVVHWGTFDVIETANEHTLVVPDSDSRAPRTYIAPGGINTKHKWFDRQLTETEMADIRSGIRAVYVFGRVEYKDAFGKKRSTSYRLRYTLAAYPPVGPTTFTYCEAGNSADDKQE